MTITNASAALGVLGAIYAYMKRSGRDGPMVEHAVDTLVAVLRAQEKVENRCAIGPER